MNRDEIERLKEAEKSHLKKVRELKAQLKDARRQRGVADALRAMDTSGLDDEFDQALRDMEHQNVTSEARYEMAVDALDEAAAREQARLETERFEAEQRKAAATDLVSKLKAELGSSASGSSEETGANAEQRQSGSVLDDRDDEGPERAKTIGRPRSRPQ